MLRTRQVLGDPATILGFGEALRQGDVSPQLELGSIPPIISQGIDGLEMLREDELRQLEALDEPSVPMLSPACQARPSLASDSTAGSWNDRPMIRFTSYTVLRGLVATCALAEAPTILPEEVKATQLGMVRPDGVGITSACWVWSFHTARHEYVVPRSIPMMGPGMVAIRLQSVSL